MLTKEQLMDFVIKTYGLEDPFTIDFCQEAEQKDSNVANLCLIITAYITMKEVMD